MVGLSQYLKLSFLLVAMAAFGALSVSADVIDESDLVAAVQVLSQQCEGAATATKRELMKEFRSAFEHKVIRFRSARVRKRLYVFGWEPQPGSVQSSWSMGVCGNHTKRLPKDPHAEYSSWVSDDGLQTMQLENWHGSIRIIIVPTFKSREQATQIENGPTVYATVKVRLFDLTFDISDRFPPNRINVLGQLESHQYERRYFQCGKGHRYSPSSGYTLCPSDGEPLNFVFIAVP